MDKFRRRIAVNYDDNQLRRAREERVIPLSISPFASLECNNSVHEGSSSKTRAGDLASRQEPLEDELPTLDKSRHASETAPSASSSDEKSSHESVARRGSVRTETKGPNDAALTARRPSVAPPRDLLQAEEHVQEHEKTATYSELFYDLFFVANLTVFASKNEIGSVGGMGKFIGFFGTLWLVYCHQTMFDVRFETWDVCNIFLRIVQLGALATFSASSTKYTDSLVNYYAAAFAVSKASLAVQYFITLCWARSPKAGKAGLVRPLAIHVGLNILVGCMWAGSTAIDGSAGSAQAARYSIWGVAALIEVLTHAFTGILFAATTFRHTHIIERVGILSLIILGEGVIGIGNVANQIAGTAGWTSMTVLNFASAIAIIFLLFFLYFTNSRKTFDVSPWLMHLWIYMHFFFHLAVLLLASGTGLALLIQNTSEAYVNLINYPPNFPNVNGTELASLFTASASGVNVTLPTTAEMTDFNIFEDMASSALAFHGIVIPTYQETQALEAIIPQMANASAQLFGQLGNLKSLSEVIAGDDDEYTSFVEHLLFVFNFLLTSLGVVLIFQAVIALLTETRHDRFSLCYALSRLVLGIPLILINTLFINSETGQNFLESGWPLPMMALILFAQAIIDQVIARFAARRYRKHDLKMQARRGQAS